VQWNVPVGYDAVLDRVLEREDTTLGLSLVTDVRVLLAHANHHALMARTANDGREHGTRGIISRETGLHHAGTVINNERSDLQNKRHETRQPSTCREKF